MFVRFHILYPSKVLTRVLQRTLKNKERAQKSFNQSENEILICTRVKDTKSLWLNQQRIVRFKQGKKRNGKQKERILSKRIQIKPTLHVKITLNINR